MAVATGARSSAPNEIRAVRLEGEVIGITFVEVLCSRGHIRGTRTAGHGKVSPNAWTRSIGNVRGCRPLALTRVFPFRGERALDAAAEVLAAPRGARCHPPVPFEGLGEVCS